MSPEMPPRRYFLPSAIAEKLMSTSRESAASSARDTRRSRRPVPAPLRLLRPPGPEAVPVDLRAGTQDPPEVLAQIARRAESAAVRDSLDGQVTRLQQPLREMDPFPHDPLIGRGPVLATNRRANMRGLIAARAARSATVTSCQGGRAARPRVGEQACVVQGRHRCLDELGLAAVAVQRHHEVTGEGWRSQCRSRAGRHAGTGPGWRRCPPRSAGLRRRRRAPRGRLTPAGSGGQLGALRPVRRRRMPVQDARRGQDERARAQRQQAAASPPAGAQRLEYLGRHPSGCAVGRTTTVSAVCSASRPCGTCI